MDLKQYIASIPDFPEPGIIFRDITPLMQNKEAYHESIKQMKDWIQSLNQDVDLIASPEARGFLF